MTPAFDASMYGAVDLSGLAARAAAPSSPTPPSEGGATIEGSFVIDVTALNLRDALETSASVPVVLYFYTPRAEQTVVLDGKLQQLAQDRAGRFQLGRVNADTSADVAQAVGIEGLPAAVLLLQGQPIPLFQGIPADDQLPSAIDQVLQAGAQYGITGVLAGGEPREPAEPALPPHMAEAYAALEQGNTELARTEFKAALKVNPSLREAHIGIDHIDLAMRVQQVDRDAALEEAQRAPLTDIAAHMTAADIEVFHGYPDAAFARLIDVIKVTSGDERNAVRERLLELFEVVGADQPVVSQARRALASALF